MRDGFEYEKLLSWVQSIVLGLVAGVLCYIIIEGIIDKERTEAPVNAHDSLGVSYLYDGEEVRWYVFTDPDTGVQYLFNDKGGSVQRAEGAEG